MDVSGVKSDKLSESHGIVQNVLGITIKRSEKRALQGPQDAVPQKLYIGHLYGRLTGFKQDDVKYLSLQDVDDVVRAMIYVCILHNRNVLVTLNESYTRALEALGKGTSKLSLNHMSVNELTELLEAIQNALVYNGSLLIVCPDYFTLTDILEKDEIKRAYLDLSTPKARSDVFIDFALSAGNGCYLGKLVEHIWNSDEEVATAEFTSVFDTLRLRMSLKGIKATHSGEIKALVHMLSFKPLVKLFIEDIERVELESSLQKDCGAKRELLSIIGQLLNASSLNEESLEVSKLIGLNKTFYEGLQPERIDFHGKRDLNIVKMLIATKRSDYERSVNDVLQLAKLVLKADAKLRSKFLSLFGRFASFNTTRRKVLRLTHIDSGPMTLDPLYYRRMALSQDNTFGFSINLAWLLLLLSQGITFPKAEEIDVAFCQVSNMAKAKTNSLDSEMDEEKVQQLKSVDEEINHMLSFLVNTPSCMGDENQVVEAIKKLDTNALKCYDGKFITQIFWLTLKGLIMLFLPALQENLKILTHTLNYANNTQNLSPNDEKLAEYISHVYAWRTMIQHPCLIKALWHFINLSLRVFLRCALFYKADGSVNTEYRDAFNASKMRYSVLVEKYCESVSGDSCDEEQPPQFTVLPVDFIECILDLIKNITLLKQYDAYIKPPDGNALDGMDFELVVATCVFLMKCSNNMVKNIHIKCDLACSTILFLSKYSKEPMHQFETLPVSKAHLMDALCRTFIASQKASYNTRISSRLNIIQSLSQFFTISSYKKSFVTCIISKRELFVQFLHLLLNDTTFLIEEVVSYLTEIKRREVAGISLDDAPEQEEREEDDNQNDHYTQDGSIDANQLKSMSGSELKGRTRTFVEYGYEICSLLHILCNEFPGEITNSSVLLPQVSTCLGCCLESLAGQKCLQLKVRNMDEYGFKPKEWLSKIMQCYISLYEFNNEDKSPFIKAIVQNERYYRPEVFNRCIRFSTREMFLNYKAIKSFNALSNKLLEYAKKTSMMYDEATNEEIPEHYLDPIMMDIMEDPVLLPTSGKIMDRKNIERHLMSEATDPFTRAPLSREDLVEQVELRKEIESFVKSIGNKNV
ncbi:ubiquitination-mediated degradation protein, putative [Theileria equi strain WA]|uniref:RING-type E3 ubiquitin transferase n=1 Tax=Theileria equi strain WA TaxID=1537102 RepID=L1LF79_THEEQ|nr:ubiquitination-mediated degradation protein, putative [Theileria equi strain WA]EKX73900.1 ubiquitination-mediated degradation protein, putative [Theileria equi strain WA]|eukprot:XP_004833352.1 ubiquitination-mediated degradation protein, putative [Theileria equi strain WA]